MTRWNIHHTKKILKIFPFIFPQNNNHMDIEVLARSGTDPEIFQRGIEEENFESKMFADTRINAYTHKN